MGGVPMNVRECLELASQDQISPDHLYEFFSQQMPRLTVVYQNSEVGRRPLLSKSNHPNGKYVIAFTDIEAARRVRVQHPEYLDIQEESALPFLLKAFRSDAEGIVINPSLPSRLFIDKPRLIGLISAYSVHRLSRSAGAWLLSKGNELLLAPYQQGKFTVVIYTTEKDARHVSAQQGGEVKLYPWEEIFQRVERLGAPAPLFHSGLPEQMLLTQSQVLAIQQGPKSGFVEPETIQYPFVPVIGQSAAQDQPVSDVSTDSSHSSDESSTQFEQPASTVLTEASLPKAEITQYMPTVDSPVSSSNVDNKVEEKKVEVEPEVAITVPPVQELQHDKEKISSSTSHDSKQNEVKEPEIPLETEMVEQPELDNQPMNFENQKSKEESKVAKQSEEPNHLDDLNPLLEENLQGAPSTDSPPETVSQLHHVVPGNVSIAPDVKAGLERLEMATIAGQGVANGWEVCRLLAEIRRVWVITDSDGNMVILAGQDQSPIVDFFTSDVHAQQLIQETHQQNSSLPQMTPCLVSTKKLYRALANRQPIVWINRGTSIAWTSVMGDTIPYILQLMAQNERNQN